MLKKRIDILEDASIISKDVSDFVKQTIDLLVPIFEGTDANMEMFVTHLAMATQRIVSEEEVEQMDDTLWKDIKKAENFASADAIYMQIEELAPCGFPESEKRFIIMHLCNLYQ